jgi:hypothetical protein
MADIEINDLANFGVIRDVEGYQLPPEAFTQGDNMRFTNDGVERIGGHEQVFGTPGVAPHFAMPIQNASQTYWLYVSLTKGYVYDGSTHTNITRQTAAVDVNYTASETREWNGTLLGGVPILNNGVDLPQYWPAMAPATKLDNLANWPSTLRAKVIRAFGPYLMALNCTKSGTNYPHMVKWSHPADPGTIPASWDETDPTLDAGEKELPDSQAGLILDGLPLGQRFFIYKNGSVWKVSLIGGQYIFDFGNSAFIETAGLLAPRCLTITGDGTRHVFASQDDILVHNGTSVESVLGERFKKYLLNNIDSSNYVNSFMYTDPFNNEVVFCYPEQGETNPNKAVAWNYRVGQKGCLSERDITFRNATTGVIESATAMTWASATAQWSNVLGPWSIAIRRKGVACDVDNSKFQLLESGTSFDGTSFTGTLQRTGLGMVGKKRNGEWIVDFKKRKLVQRLWIKATGGPVNVRVGAQREVEGAISWTAPKAFTPGTDRYVDFMVDGAAISVEFSAAVPFRISGYKLEIMPTGEF